MARNGNGQGVGTLAAKDKREADTIIARALSPAESLRLSKLESTIGTGIQTFVEVGVALREIRDSKLYRENWTTFEDYARERWGWTRQHANRVIGASSVALELEPMGSTLPERALRPLVNLPSEERKSIFTKAKVLAGEKPVTTKHVKAAIWEQELPAGPIKIITNEVELSPAERRREWENGVIVGAQAALSAVREHPDFKPMSRLVITYVMGELFASKNRQALERDLRLYVEMGAITSPTDDRPATEYREAHR